ncbi:hypothetical protein BX600DRAFT_148728 [Xylariales sp. PMI_506]|nr:hypothetical protein BX600DRAFT_148728 [Xylariales sp. PMI_506]
MPEMDRALATAEILHIICSYLKLEDQRRFRLCCRAFAAVGACYAFRKVIFYLHQRDFDMLRSLSLNENAANNVHTLVYVGSVLSEAKVAFSEFEDVYKKARAVDKAMARLLPKSLRPPQGAAVRPEMLYQWYESQIERQKVILKQGLDFEFIREAVARFPALRSVIMSTGELYHVGNRTPFDGCVATIGDYIEPVGCRHLDALLSAVAGTGIRLQSLQAGLFSWKFFQKDSATLSRALAPCRDLTSLELSFNTGVDEDTAHSAEATAEIAACRAVMRSGLVREFVASLANLETLSLDLAWYHGTHGFRVSLDDLIIPRHRWENLENLSLRNIITDRQELMSVFKKHRDTLKSLELEDIRLRKTSWLILLPQIRKTLDLEGAFLCGELYGRGEEVTEDELFDLGTPESDPNPLRDAIADYLIDGGRFPMTDADNSFSLDFNGGF